MRSRRLSLVRTTWLVTALFLSLPSAAVRAQTSMTAFLPEVNSHFRLSSNVRLVFDAKGYMEDGELNRAQVGPSLQFNIRPLEKLKRITIFDMEDMKPMPVVFTIGYRCSPPSTVCNRLSCFTSRFPRSFCCRTGTAGTLTGRTAVSIGRIETDSQASGA